VATIPFVGPSYNLESRPASVQRTINLVPVPQEPGNERTSWVFKDAPGLVLVQDFAGGGPGDWLGYDDGGFGPGMVNDASQFQALGTPVAFEDGVTFSNSVTSNGGTSVYVPLSGGSAEAPTLVEGVTWFPEVQSDPAPTITTTDPSSGTWTGFTWVLEATASGFVVLEGLTGTTVITLTVDGAPFYYNGAALEYFDTPTPPSATTAVLPYDEPAEIAEDVTTWFTFTLASPATIDFFTTGAGFYTQIGLFAANGALIAEANANLGGFNSGVIGQTLPAGTFYAAVAGEQTIYTFGFGATPSSPTETGELSVVIEVQEA
jgi:hypothetical protein